MNTNKLKKMPMPLPKRIEKKINNWLEEYLNEPVAEAGYPNTAAALSAVLSAAGDLLIPDDIADAAATLVPGGKLLKAGAKGMKKLVKGADGKIPVKSNPKPGKPQNYEKRDAAERAKKRETHGEEGADTWKRDRVKGPELIEGERNKRIREMKQPKKEPTLEEMFEDFKKGVGGIFDE